jgi:hypothetical protein
MKGEDSHILPEWGEQVEYAREFAAAIIQMRVRPGTKAKLDYLKESNPNKNWDALLEPIVSFKGKPPKVTAIINVPKDPIETPEGLPDLTRLD